jgi:hypothetical protein
LEEVKHAHDPDRIRALLQTMRHELCSGFHHRVCKLSRLCLQQTTTQRCNANARPR